MNELTLKKDAGTFHLKSGTLCFVAPVQGKVTGAVFVGEGSFVLEPPLPVERGSLRLLTKQQDFVESFSHLVLRFTDGTYDEIKKTAGTGTGSCDAGLLQESQKTTRKKLNYNLEGRILQDILGTEPGGLFVAFIHGKHYNDKEVYAIDPHGAPPFVMPIAPEEVEFVTYDESKVGVWGAFHGSREYTDGTASGAQQNATLHISHQILDTTIEKNAELFGKATTTFVSQVNGLRVVPFDLFGHLRIDKVTADTGEPLSFIQEDKKDDPNYFVILPKPLNLGDQYTVIASYAGKEAVSNEGGGNYYPIARHNWYPNNANLSLGEYSAYDLTFHIPKGMKMASTGTLISEKSENNQSVSVWKSEAPLTVAGFNFGKFKGEEGKLDKSDFKVEAYANQELPDDIRAIQQYAEGSTLGQRGSSGLALGTMTTTGMVKKALVEGQLAVRIYTDYFGPTPFQRLAMTQQTAFS